MYTENAYIYIYIYIYQSEWLTERIKEPPRGRCLQGAVDARWVVVVVVECYCFLINIIVEPPLTMTPSLLLHKSVIFHFSERFAAE